MNATTSLVAELTAQEEEELLGALAMEQVSIVTMCQSAEGPMKPRFQSN